MTTNPSRLAGRRWAYAALVLGGTASIAANVAHCWVGGTPQPGAVIASVLWPVLLLVAVELLTGPAWPSGWAWTLTRVGGVGTVALVAALVSFTHLSSLLRHYGESPLVSSLGPIAIDGLMLMATAYLLAASRQARETAATTAHRHDGTTAVSRSVEVEPAASTQTPVPAAPTPRRRSTKPSTRPAGRPSTPTRPATRPAAAGDGPTFEERVEETRRLIAAGDLPTRPAAEAIRKAVRCKAETARQIRDVIATQPAADPAPVVDPQQMAIDDVLGDPGVADLSSDNTRPRLVA